jgi:hypothetical protein
MTPITYYPDRTVLLVYAVGSCILISLLLWLVSGPNDLGSKILYSTLIYVFGIALFFSLKSYLSNNPLLIIDSDGITDNASAFSAGFVPWSDITHLSVTNAPKNYKYLNLHVKNPETYINRLNAQKSTLIKKPPNLKNYTLKIPDALLPVSADELLKIVNQARPEL